MAESIKRMKQRLNDIIPALEEKYPDAKCFLNHNNPYELLIATRLSAQTTDERVNMVTPALFHKYPTLYDLADANLDDVENLIKSVGLYKTKAKDIIASCRVLRDKYNGEVPADMEKLTSLPGVGRKTASVVLGNAFGIPAIAVDTHFGRIMRRLGFTLQTNPEKVESEILKLVPKEKQVSFCHRVISHGRAICKSRKPECDNCFLSEYCKKILK